MKYCPICDERYDEEIIRFCTKDGTPLIEDETPNFTVLPSESTIEADEDDIGEQTIIRRKDDSPTPFDDRERSERIVIPTTAPEPQVVRPRTVPAYYPPPPQPNTAKTVILTILGTVGLLGCGALLFWMLQGDRSANLNVNVNTNGLNQNVNLNTNLGFDSNFNFNTNANYASNYNFNYNFNANIKTPTATPSSTPTPRATASPTLSPTPGNTSAPTPRPTSSPRPSNTNAAPVGTPRTGPRPPANLSNRPIVN